MPRRAQQKTIPRSRRQPLIRLSDYICDNFAIKSLPKICVAHVAAEKIKTNNNSFEQTRRKLGISLRIRLLNRNERSRAVSICLQLASCLARSPSIVAQFAFVQYADFRRFQEAKKFFVGYRLRLIQFLLTYQQMFPKAKCINRALVSRQTAASLCVDRFCAAAAP